MEISEHEYARLVRWAEEQQRRLAALEWENHELRQQVNDLRRGVGIAVVVQGRMIPVDPAPAEMPQPNAGPMPHPSFGPALQHAPRSAPAQPSQPHHMPPIQPTPSAPPAPRSQVFSEEMWITGQTRAVKPPPALRPTSLSQEMTPSWLREDAPQSPTPPPAPRRTLATATGSHPAMPKPPRTAPPERQQSGRQRVQARPLSRPSDPRLEAVPLPTLAQLTGQQPAVRIPGREPQQPDERTPYSDSFVLG